MPSMAVDIPAWIEWQRLLLVRERAAEEADALGGAGGAAAVADADLLHAGVRGAAAGGPLVSFPCLLSGGRRAGVARRGCGGPQRPAGRRCQRVPGRDRGCHPRGNGGGGY